MDAKRDLESLFLDALEACSPSNAIQEAIHLEGDRLSIADQEFYLKERRVYLFAVGKASVPMANAALEILGNHIEESLVITSDKDQAESCRAGEVIVGAHPVPNEQSVKAGQKTVEFFESIPRESLVLCLISGGTSSLLCLPAEGISVGELNQTFDLLNNSGATIYDINTVRKHCSQIKGGQLLDYLDPNLTLIDLVISDVPNDDLRVIGSGPTTPDQSTYQDAYHILLEQELWDRLPESVRQHIEKGIDGEVPDTLKPGEDPLAEHHSHIISSARKLAEQISEMAGQRGYQSWIADRAFNEDVEQVASNIAEKVLAEKSENEDTVYIFYGESTVNVSGSGKGGRNQELALRGALKIAERDSVTWLSAGTDGIDGPTDAAGAVVDGQTIAEAKQQGMDPEEYLQNNDSYHFHEQLDTLLKPGPTGNNLMDLVLVIAR